MEEVAEIVAYEQKHFNGEEIPEDSIQGENISLGTRILKIIIDFDSLVSKNQLQLLRPWKECSYFYILFA